MSYNSQMDFKTQFGNELSEIDFIRRVLLELGVVETTGEIDRAITLVKVDVFQDEMKKNYDPEMVGNEFEDRVSLWHES